jgi:hypothetical protein
MLAIASPYSIITVKLVGASRRRRNQGHNKVFPCFASYRLRGASLFRTNSFDKVLLVPEV